MNHRDRFPRTLKEGFGPYAEWHRPERQHWTDRYPVVLAAIVGIAYAVLFFLGV